MSAVDDIERHLGARGIGRPLTALEDAIDTTWPCCTLCHDVGHLGAAPCFCVMRGPPAPTTPLGALAVLASVP